MVIERIVHRAGVPGERLEHTALLLRERGVDVVADVDPRERSHAVHPFLVAERLVVGEFQVRPALGGFAEVVGVLVYVDLVGDDVPAPVHHPERPVVIFKRAVGRDKPDEHGAEAAEIGDVRRELLVDPPEGFQRDLRGLLRFGNPCQEMIPLCGIERLAHSPGHRPRRVDAAAPENFDDLLPELSEPDPPLGELLVLRDKAEDVPRRGVGIEPEKEIGRREMEETERVRLYPLCERDQPAQLLRRLRDRDREDVVSRLRGGDEMARGQMPQMREVMPPISHMRRPSQNFSNPRNSFTWNLASMTFPGHRDGS